MSQEPPIYLDYNGTTPIHPEIRKMMIQELSTQISSENEFLSLNFGNPSAGNTYGIDAAITLNEARQNVAKILNCQQNEVYFTSGGTESNNTVIIGSVLNAKLNHNIKTPVIITTRYEHPATNETIQFCQKSFGAEVRQLGNDERGRLRLDELPSLLDENVVLVTIMWANNEFGTVNDVPAIAAAVRRFESAINSGEKGLNESQQILKHKIIVHADCAQAIGKVPVDVSTLDAASLAGHKLYAPKGIGALYLKEGTKIIQLLHGGGQESGLRPGTENVLYAKALGMACLLAQNELEERMAHSWRLIRILAQEIGLTNDQINGALADYDLSIDQNAYGSENKDGCGCGEVVKHKSGKSLKLRDVDFLPNTLSIQLCGLDGSRVAERLRRSVSIAAGAACHAAIVSPSKALKSLGMTDKAALSTVRLSVGLGLTESACRRAGQEIKSIVMAFGGVDFQSGKSEETANGMENGSSKFDAALKSSRNGVGTKDETPKISEILEKSPSNFAPPKTLQMRPQVSEASLLDLTTGLGCGCKLPAAKLQAVLGVLGATIRSDDLLVGPETADDAAVFRLHDGRLLVATVDFFGPPVNDCIIYGASAAANALSDVYAMGGTPFLALSVASFPSKELSIKQMQDIMLGANRVCQEAHTIIAGGHTVDAPEPLFGLCCIGIIEKPEDLKRNFISGVQALQGQNISETDNSTYLIITKPLGAGIIAKAIKTGTIKRLEQQQQVEKAFGTFLSTLNTGFLTLSDQLRQSVTAMTDVTGFGLVGHLAEMLAPGKLSAEIFCRSLPVLPGVIELLSKAGGFLDPGTANLLYAKHLGVKVHGTQQTDQLRVASDPCTSGGLLLAVQGLENAYKIQQQLYGQIIGRVYKNPDQPEILLLNEQFMPFEQRYGYFKE